jgi:exonuclease VII small subunit
MPNEAAYFNEKAGCNMPTQEERLSTLEQSVVVLNRVISDINHNETMLLGMAMKQGESLRAFEQNVTSRFDEQDKKLEAQIKKLEAQDQKLDQIMILLTTLAPKPDQDA